MKRQTIAALIAASLGILPAVAQDHSAQGSSNVSGQLQALCGTADAMAPAPTAMTHQMDAAHAALMEGMDEMHQQMMTGMMAEDVDIAFVCGMIPHHQGAIAMAQAELEHGDDPWVKEMAQKVIDAQEQEITEMLDWLSKHSK